jgi:hypothetical protein
MSMIETIVKSAPEEVKEKLTSAVVVVAWNPPGPSVFKGSQLAQGTRREGGYLYIRSLCPIP